MSLGPAEILVVLVLALVVFGPKKLPEVGRQVGGALRELRKIQDSVQTEIRSVMDDTMGPVGNMFPNPLAPHKPPDYEPVPQPMADAPPTRALPAAEPDLGDEANTPPPVRDPESAGGPGIDGLSGGTFS